VADWFVRNVRDLRWRTHDKFGAAGSFEPETGGFDQLGINIRVLEPGQPNCLYHRENLQEDFLVLSGECLLLVDGEERPLKAWDFVHMPPDVDHVFVGAGDGPCAILMAGARSPDEKLFYPAAEIARKHGAAAEEDTPSPEEAYAPFGERHEGRPASWDTLPWA
jgi:uncharacterized cupin superfamily protein